MHTYCLVTVHLNLPLPGYENYQNTFCGDIWQLSYVVVL